MMAQRYQETSQLSKLRCPHIGLLPTGTVVATGSEFTYHTLVWNGSHREHGTPGGIPLMQRYCGYWL